MTMKQAVSLLLGASLCFPLSGCGKESASVETSTAAVVTEATAAEETNTETTALPENSDSSAHAELPKPADGDLVAVKDYIPDISVELKYATAENFTGHVIYEFQDAYLRYGTVKKLMAVQEELRGMGLSLKIWDSFRPRSAQYKLWEVYPDDTYVANPETGNSNHSRGNAVDVTLVDSEGKELEMPSEFDDFSGKADRNYSDCTDAAAQNSGLLQHIMEKNGFKGYSAEWWHYNDTVRYDVEEKVDPAVVSRWYADCREFISLRELADVTAETVIRIPAGEEVTLLGYDGEFAYADYQNLRGYVLAEYLQPLGETGYADCQEFISLRTEPDTAAAVITRIPVNGEVTLINSRGTFAWVSYNGKLGYVLSDYLRLRGETMRAVCEEFISLRVEPDTMAEVITRIPAGDTMTLLAYDGDFAWVEYQNQRGYVRKAYLEPER